MSLHATTNPPCSVAARSTSRDRHRSRAHSGTTVAVHAKTRDTAVGKDVEANVRRRARSASTANSFVRVADRDRPARGAATTRRRCAMSDSGDGTPSTSHASRLARSRIVAGEEARVDDDAANDPGKPESNDRPVVPGRATTARFPAVHPLAALGVDALAPFRWSRLDESLLRREELVVRRDHRRAEALARKVGKIGESRIVESS